MNKLSSMKRFNISLYVRNRLVSFLSTRSVINFSEKVKNSIHIAHTQEKKKRRRGTKKKNGKKNVYGLSGLRIVGESEANNSCEVEARPPD